MQAWHRLPWAEGNGVDDVRRRSWAVKREGPAMLDWSRLLPQTGARYTGPRPPFYFLILIAVAGTIRSLIHIFAPDGGAASIAGLALGAGGGTNIAAIFAQWGASQMLLALFYWVAILRYRFLTPLMLLAVFIEQGLRIAAGSLKPLQAAAPPPGAIATYVLLPLALAMFLWSLWNAKRSS
ncbi:MAG: hypothetical protein ACLP7P_11405 [Rhodomicrobium sp.]